MREYMVQFVVIWSSMDFQFSTLGVRSGMSWMAEQNKNKINGTCMPWNSGHLAHIHSQIDLVHMILYQFIALAFTLVSYFKGYLLIYMYNGWMCTHFTHHIFLLHSHWLAHSLFLFCKNIQLYYNLLYLLHQFYGSLLPF